LVASAELAQLGGSAGLVGLELSAELETSAVELAHTLTVEALAGRRAISEAGLAFSRARQVSAAQEVRISSLHLDIRTTDISLLETVRGMDARLVTALLKRP
jgi:hypothetical protein